MPSLPHTCTHTSGSFLYPHPPLSPPTPFSYVRAYQVAKTTANATALETKRLALECALASAHTEMQKMKEASEAQIEALRVERSYLKVGAHATFVFLAG